MTFRELRPVLFVTMVIAATYWMVYVIEQDAKRTASDNVRAANVQSIITTYREHHEDGPRIVNGQLLAGSAPRSSKWPPVRNAVIAAHPSCAICDATGPAANLNVHHKTPYHVDPKKELDPANLRTLCRDHHGHVGHSCGGDVAGTDRCGTAGDRTQRHAVGIAVEGERRRGWRPVSYIPPVVDEGVIDSEDTSDVICPWCGHEHSDSWECIADDRFECHECCRPFVLVILRTSRETYDPDKKEVRSECTDVTYSTTRCEDYDPSKES